MEFPKKPFLTKDFSPDGGGIDFLGLRWVNLAIVGQYLIPEINNVTRDMGTFFLAAWIPWKFIELCKENKNLFTESNYKKFREKVEVAISSQYAREHNGELEGYTRNKVGNDQKLTLPSILSFESVKRNTSVFDAAIYGPSIKYLRLIEDYKILTKDGTLVNIPKPQEDERTAIIINSVDKALRNSTVYEKFTDLNINEFTKEELNNLGNCGLYPEFYTREDFDSAKNIFLEKLLPSAPEDLGYKRTLTAKLLIYTLNNNSDSTTTEIRSIWYTGFNKDGTPFQIDDFLKEQYSSWSCFIARQNQRYIIEQLLQCFELALKFKVNSVDRAVDYLWNGEDDIDKTFEEFIFQTAEDSLNNIDSKSFMELSINWNNEINPGSSFFKNEVELEDKENLCQSTMKMLAAWFLRMFKRVKNDEENKLYNLGTSDRVSIKWFIEWIEKRKEFTIRKLLCELFTDIIFCQHTRIALSRYDGKTQRLRFVLGDNGIEVTESAKRDLAKRQVNRMPDRLDTLVDLLCDTGVIKIDDEKKLSLTDKSSLVEL